MVRTAIACAWCRKSKIKCVHDGSPPCRSCRQAGRDGPGQCALSLPDLTRKRGRSPGDHNEGDVESREQNTKAPQRRLPKRSISYHQGGRPADGLDTSVAQTLRAIAVFSKKFPELGFLHTASVTQALKRQRQASGRVDGSVLSPDSDPLERSDPRLSLLCTAILALALPLMDEDLAHAPYASHVRDRVSPVEPPHVLTVQTLLVISMYEWSNGSGYRAWMYAGMAIRMMQSLDVMAKSSSLTETDRRIHNRTYWSCFIMDGLVFCGRSQPPTLTLPSLGIPWPVGEQHFALGRPSPRPRCNNAGRSDVCSDGLHGDIDHYYEILVRGYHTWSRILRWVVDGGRRMPGMSTPENYPWVKGSAWRNLYESLQSWRDSQDPSVHYPETQVEGHVSLGTGEAFTYINLVYYIGLLILGREYMPFIPTPESEPNGPTEAPLLESPAPDGWWSDRTEELFCASSRITRILQEAEEADAPLLVPFAGFCAFSAATMNIYVACFPRMNLGRSAGAGAAHADAAADMRYLDRFRAVWPIGVGWWITIRHTRRHYERASLDRVRYHGKTKADFESLFHSIHDPTGSIPADLDDAQSPPQTVPQTPRETAAGDHGSGMDHHGAAEAAALGLQELSHGAAPAGAAEREDLFGGVHDNSLLWPLWGEQQNFPFAIEGIPFDYDLNLVPSPP